MRRDGGTRRINDRAVLARMAPPVARPRGTGCQHGLRLGDFLIRGGEACVHRWNLMRAHAEATLEARLAASDGRRQCVVVTGDETTRGGAPPRPNGLDPVALAIMMSRCMR